jgi:hypothetical protein
MNRDEREKQAQKLGALIVAFCQKSVPDMSAVDVCIGLSLGITSILRALGADPGTFLRSMAEAADIVTGAKRSMAS